MSYRLSYARLDPAHCLAPGLFRCIAPGRRHEGLHVWYEQRNGSVIQFSGSAMLGPDDMLLLAVLLAIVGRQCYGLPPVPQTPVGRDLRDRLALDGVWGQCVTLAGAVTYRSMEEGLGYPHRSGGAAWRQMRKSIQRLETTRIVQDGLTPGASQLLSYTESASKPTTQWIALNPRLAGAVDVKRKGRYTRIGLEDLRLLHRPASRILYTRLSAWVDPGASRRLMLDTAATYCYPESGTVKPATRRKRLAVVSKALADLQLVNWLVTAEDGGRVSVSRPR